MANSEIGSLDFEQLETAEAPSLAFYAGVAAGAALWILVCTS